MSYNAKEFKDNFNFIEYIKQHYITNDTGGKLYISCPFHSENTPSCLISNKGFFCFGCGEKGDSITFLMETLSISFKEVINNDELDTYIFVQNLSTQHGSNKVISYRYPSTAMAYNFNNNLLRRKKKLEYLKTRMIDEYTVKCAMLGYGKPSHFRQYNAPRYIIPVTDESSRIVTIRYRIDPEFDDGSEPKYLAHPKTPSILYNIQLLESYNDVVIVGSELDAAFLVHRFKIIAVATPGENVWKYAWGKHFQDKNVLVWLDNDEAGWNGMVNIYHKIKHVAKNIRLYKWDRNLPSKYDIGDFARDNGISAIYNTLQDYEIYAY